MAKKNLTFSEKYQEPLVALENNRKMTKNLNKYKSKGEF